MGRQTARVVVVLAWITLTLRIDATATATTQLALGGATWLLLAALLARESALVWVQVAVVVAFATVIEYVFSQGLEVYVYRLDQVPAYVPPGHGLVYLGALSVARIGWTQRHQRLLTIAVGALVTGYAGFGLSPWGARPDVLGAFWALCLVVFLIWGRSQLVYVGAFAVVTYLELVGTAWGNWTWGAHDPTGWVSIGNPPSGAAGGYAWFDLAALLAAPALLAGWRTARARLAAADLGLVMGRALGRALRRARAVQQHEHLVVQHAVGADGVAAVQGA